MYKLSAIRRGDSVNQIFLFLILVVCGCDWVAYKQAPETKVNDQEEIELRRKERKHQVKVIGEFFYEVLIKSSDTLDHDRIYGIMMVYFVSHYQEGANALTQAGIRIARLLRQKEDDLELGIATNTVNLLPEQAAKSQHRSCESRRNVLFDSDDDPQSQKNILKGKIVSDFFNEVIKNLPTEDIKNRIAILGLMISFFSDCYPKPLSSLLEAQDGNSSHERTDESKSDTVTQTGRPPSNREAVPGAQEAEETQTHNTGSEEVKSDPSQVIHGIFGTMGNVSNTDEQFEAINRKLSEIQDSINEIKHDMESPCDNMNR